MSATGLRDKSRAEINTAIETEVAYLIDTDGLAYDDILRRIGKIRGLRISLTVMDANLRDLHAK